MSTIRVRPYRPEDRTALTTLWAAVVPDDPHRNAPDESAEPRLGSAAVSIWRRLAPLLLWVWVSTSCAVSESGADFEALAPFLDSLMLSEGVPGYGFALFDDSGVLYEHVSGVKNKSTGEPVGPETTFEAASISKPVFAYVVLSLAEEGVLDVDAPLHAIAPDVPEIGYDARSGSLTPHTLLTHQGGLPNWRSRLNFTAQSYADLFAPDDTLRFVADPNEGYRYSGEGYVLLQRLVETKRGMGLNELAKRRVFDPLRMGRTSFLFDDEARRDHSWGHNGDGEPDKWEISLSLASSTLQTTAPDLGRFGAHLASEIRSRGTYSALAEPAVTVDGEGDVVTTWGSGLGIVTDGGRRYVFHGGNNVIFIADFIYGVEENLGYALLTNSSNGQRVVGAVEERVFGRRIRP